MEVPPELLTNYFSWRTRLLLRRLLVVFENGRWATRNLEGYSSDAHRYQYIFVSYTNAHWRTGDESEGYEERRRQLERVAERLALEDGCNAYWMDFKCRAQEKEGALLDSDVNRFCDVTRGAKKVVVALPGNDPQEQAMKTWGNRMWTLPEGLLASGRSVGFFTAKTSKMLHKTKIQMTADVWNERPKTTRDVQSARLLAEHFTGLLTLGRLELFSLALDALGKRQAMKQQSDEPPKRPELAYGT